ncbi:MAG: hypothetical protein HUU55_08020 [Myxococcales bacterium]|nr:hypothetical protein [Myxococcales bacterium]
MPILTGIDLLGIQSYIFASNRLRDVLTASWLIEYVMSSEFLTSAGCGQGDIVNTAGGNAALVFGDLDTAKTFTRNYTRSLLETAPGLDVAVVHRSFESGHLASALRVIQADLARAKLERMPQIPLLGQSVTARCPTTGGPVVDIVDDEFVSAQIATLRKPAHVHCAQTRWKNFLPDKPLGDNRKATFPVQLDHLGRSAGDTSLLGVVHVDGNGIGTLIRQWIAAKNQAGDDRLRAEYREWSYDLRRLGDNVIHRLVSRIVSRIQCLESSKRPPRWHLTGAPEALGFDLYLDPTDGMVCLPFRPIVLGGDDITFVCDARIALDLAAEAIRIIENEKIRHLGMLSASVGVAMVKQHAPFSHAVGLASELCGSAKQTRRASGNSGSWIDWHIGLPKPGEVVSSIRKRQYRGKTAELTLRPYPLSGHNDVYNFATLTDSWLGPSPSSHRGGQGFRGDRLWAESRNRIKQLATLASSGPSAVEAQMDAWKTIDPSLTFPSGIDGRGLVGQRTPLIDIAELIDLHLRLDLDLTVQQGDPP